VYCCLFQLKEMPVSSLSTFQKGAQRAAFQAAAEAALREKFTSADARQLLALILHDAATYDADTRTGGFDGSIVLSRWAPLHVCACCTPAATLTSPQVVSA